MYSLIRQCLFCLAPETAHHVALQSLQCAYRLGLTHLLPKLKAAPKTIMGLQFKNPIGLAAGLDKNGEYIDALATLGFGFIEIGTVTPLPQVGNPKPRLFRLPMQQALINRLGFNGKGMDYVANQLARLSYRGILGINLGKNKQTPMEKAVDDYLMGFRRLWEYASYITINISSPNTQGLRDLHKDDALFSLLSALKTEQHDIMTHHGKYVPIVVKISPDLTDDEIASIAKTLLQLNIDGVIATNTTIARDPGLQNTAYANESGGLSGKPLQQQSTHVIQQLHQHLQEKIPIIGLGGIVDAESAQEKIQAGASLLQIYTGFIYQGPGLIRRLIQP